ncbi:hypothetical protein KY385_00515 [Candidatus Parcubacteria bacterium]|nr:hypothetical protein [Candidatus Parcubacteria bacterium]
MLLNSKLSTLRTKIKVFDNHFGEIWREQPAMMIPSIRTVIASKRALAHIGITAENTPQGTYSRLLCSSMSAKQKSSIFIRRSILGHQQIRNASQKRRMSTMVTRRQRQTDDDKKLEAREIAELRGFLQAVGSHCLYLTNEQIASKAFKRGYYNREP